MRNDVRVRVIGDWESLPPAPRRALADLQRGTANNGGMLLNLAVNYSSHAELARAVRAIAADVAAGKLHPDSVDEGADRTLPLHRRPSRTRSADSSRRRAPALELLALPGCICRTRSQRRALARFHGR